MSCLKKTMSSNEYVIASPDKNEACLMCNAGHQTSSHRHSGQGSDGAWHKLSSTRQQLMS